MTHLPINGDGAFSGDIDQTSKGARVEIHIQGAFSGDGSAVTGTMQVKVGAGSDSCDTGIVNVNADYKGQKKKKKKHKKHRHHHSINPA